MRKLPFILTFVMFLLAGCLSQTTASEVTPKPLLPIYQEKLPMMADFFDFADSGKTFLLAGSYRYIYLYDSATFEKHVVVREVDGESFFSILGAGHIDDNTWYVATGYYYPNPDYKEPPPRQNNYLRRNLSKSAVSIRQIKPAREIYNYDLKGAMNAGVFANKNHIAYRWRLVDWHTGETHTVDMAHPNGFDYQLTSDSQVITKPYRGQFYLFSNPLKKESSVWDFSSAWSNTTLMLSPNAHYALFRTEKGGCQLWQVPQKKRLGRCGHSKLWGEKFSRAVFRRDSQAFAVSTDNKITVYSTQPFEPLITLTLDEKIDIVAFNEEHLAAIDDTGMLRVWNIKENRLLGEYLFSEGSGAHSLFYSSNMMAFQPGGNKLVISNLGQLFVFDLAAEQ